MQPNNDGGYLSQSKDCLNKIMDKSWGDEPPNFRAHDVS